MSDYLWDKTGEADPEVERLEEMLGAFAHRPRPLELPAKVGARPRRFTLSRLAAAAALLLAALAGALFALRPAPTGGGEKLAHSAAPRETAAPSREAAPPEENSSADPAKEAQDGRPAGVRPARREGGRFEAAKRSGRPRSFAATEKARTRVEVAGVSRTLAARGTEEERLEAKERLVYALRLTSAKLGEVRRRVQGEDGPRPAQPPRGRTR
jgi:hypothetical protein